MTDAAGGTSSVISPASSGNIPKGEVTRLVPTRPDAELARDYRKQLVDALKPVMEIMDAAKRDGLNLGFNLSADATGKHGIQALTVSKLFTE